MGSRQSSSVVANESSSSSGSDDYAATGRRKRQAILERRNEFPARLQRAIREAETRYPAPRQHAKFLRSVRDALADWVFEAAIVTTTTNNPLSDTQDAGGPHDERDTEAQVEVALRFFPTVLGLRRYGLFPILWLSRSIHSVSFIPLFARLGTEIGSFPANERGGLVFGKSHTVFAQLAAATCCGASAEETPFCRREAAETAPSHHALVDAKFLRVIQRLREENLMTRSDIRTYKMIDVLCHQPVFPERRFRYLVDWDPTLLLSNHGREKKAALSLRLIKRFFDPDNIAGFELLFDLSMKHYPADLGFLFDTVYVVDEDKGRIKKKKQRTAGTTTQDAEGESSQHSRSSLSRTHKSCETDDEEDEPATSLFQTACDTYGKDKIQTILDGVLYGQMVRDANFTKKALLAAATTMPLSNEPQKQPEKLDEKKDRAQAIYLLLQRDPRDLRRLSLEFATPEPVRRRSYHATAA